MLNEFNHLLAHWDKNIFFSKFLLIQVIAQEIQVEIVRM